MGKNYESHVGSLLLHLSLKEGGTVTDCTNKVEISIDNYPAEKEFQSVMVDCGSPAIEGIIFLMTPKFRNWLDFPEGYYCKDHKKKKETR